MKHTRLTNSLSLEGFTLIEILISMFIILSITSVVMSIFVTGLRGSAQSSVETQVRQSGDLTLQQMARHVRNAKNFEGVSVDGATAFTSSCYQQGSFFGPTPTPQVYKALKVTAFDGGVTTIKCPAIGETVITSTSATLAAPVPLTDASTVVVSPDACYFTCEQSSPTDMPVIGINFSVESVKIGGSVGQTVDQEFHTVVVPRNYLR